MTLVPQLLREPKVCDFYLKVDFVKVDLLQEFLSLVVAHVAELVVWEMEHNILELEVSVDDQLVQHIVCPDYQLLHDLLHGRGRDLPEFGVHQLFQVPSVTEFHHDIVALLGLDGLLHSDHELALN